MNSYGNKFRVTIYGASHEKSIGVIIDGFPAGIKLDQQLISGDLKRRRPNKVGTTKRIEQDEYEIINGVFNGYTTGASINISIPNKDVKSKDYEKLKNHPRPSHADFVAIKKYDGYNDYRGGGIFSGRLTAPLVIAGSLAKMILPYKFESSITRLGNLVDLDDIDTYLEEISKKGDSVGGEIKLVIKDVPVGIGDPLFNKLDGNLSHILMSIPGVKGIQFGSKIKNVYYGSDYNDIIIDKEGKTKTNHSGGIVGGISNGNDIVLSVFIKPTPSISLNQDTYNLKADNISSLKIKGRHDVAFIRRLPVVIENACAIVLANYEVKNNRKKVVKW